MGTPRRSAPVPLGAIVTVAALAAIFFGVLPAWINDLASSASTALTAGR
ncbi:MAG: hypothetical protein U0P45_16530 [Acidimicrobiales bacterium]